MVLRLYFLAKQAGRYLKADSGRAFALRYLRAVSGAHPQVLPGQSRGCPASRRCAASLRQAQRRASHPFLWSRWSLARHPLWICKCVAVPRRMQSVDMGGLIARAFGSSASTTATGGAKCSASALLICPKGSAE